MQIIYKNDKLKDVCNNLKLATRKYGIDVARSLHRVLDFLAKAENLKDVSLVKHLILHQLKGNRQDQYSITILNSSKYRLIVYPLDENNNVMKSLDNESLMFIKCIRIQIEEVSEHYE